MELISEEQVSQLQISVDDLPGMDIFQGLSDLMDVVFCLKFSNTFSSFKQIIEGLAL
jgi:hypothetical protein